MEDTLMFYPSATLEASGNLRHFSISECFNGGRFLLTILYRDDVHKIEYRKYDTLQNAIRAAERMFKADIKREKELMEAFEEGIPEEQTEGKPYEVVEAADETE